MTDSTCGCSCGTGTPLGNNTNNLPLAGDPNSPSGLAAVGKYGYIEVTWQMPTLNPGATSFIQIWRSKVNDVSTATHINSVSGTIYNDPHDDTDTDTYYFWISLVSIHGTVFPKVGPVSAHVLPSIEKVLQGLASKIDSGILAQSLRSEIERIAALDTHIAQETLNRLAENTALSQALALVQSDLGAATTLIQNEIQARTDDHTAIVTSLNTLAAGVSGNASAIIQEQQARADAVSAVASSVTTLDSRTTSAEAAIVAESTTRAGADSALSQSITSLVAVVDGKATTAALTTEQQARVAGDTALASSITTLESRTTTAEAAIQSTSQTLANSTSAQASTNTQLSASINGKGKVIYSTTEPAVADRLAQNLWIDTAGGANTPKMWNGTAWAAVTDKVASDAMAKATTAAADIITEATARASADSALANQITQVQTTLNGNISSVQQTLQSNIDTTDGKVTAIGALYTLKVNVNGLVGGFGVYNDGSSVEAGFDVDKFWIGRTSADKKKPFIISNGVVYLDSAVIQTLTADKIDTRNLTIKDANGNVLFSSGVNLDYSRVAGATKPIQYQLGSRGASAVTYPADMIVGVKNLSTSTTIGVAARSYTLTILTRSTGALVSSTGYDVYGAGATQSGRDAAALATALNAATGDQLVIVTTADEPMLNRLTGGLNTAMYRCGASRVVFGSPNFKSRSAYILIGVPGCGEGSGFEAYAGDVTNDPLAWCSTTFSIQNGQVTIGGASKTPSSLSSYGYTGDLNATYGAPGSSPVGPTTASALVTLAGDAKTNADSALLKLSNIASDGVLTAGEKPQVIHEYWIITNEQAGLEGQATTNGVTTQKTDYTAAVAALTTYLNTLTTPTLWNSTTGDTNVVAATFWGKFQDVYTKRQLMLNAMVTNAKAATTAAAGAASAAQQTADDAVQAAADAASSAQSALDTLTTWGSDDKLSPVEKPGVLQLYNTLITEQTGIDTQANTAGIANTSGTKRYAYNAAISTLTTYLGTLTGWNVIPGTPVAIVGTTFRQKFLDAYTARQELLNLIAEKASQTATWSGTSGRPKLYRVVSTGYSATAAPVAPGLWDMETNTKVYSAALAYNVIKIQRSTATIVEKVTFNTFAAASNADSMATYLNALTTDYYVVICTSDEPKANRTTTNLLAAMKRCGASSAIYGSANFKTRGAYILIGVPGCGEGNGTELYAGMVDSDVNAWCEIMFYIQNGTLVTSGSNSFPKFLTDYGYIGDLDATKGAPAGTYVGTKLAESLVADTAAALTAVTNIGSDNVLTTGEKSTAIQAWNVINNNKTAISDNAISLGLSVESGVFLAAVNTLSAYLTGLSPAWNDTSQNTTIVGTTWRSQWQTFYAAQQTIFNQMFAKAATTATWAGIPSGSGKPQDNATKNTVTYSATAPISPTDGDLWCDQSTNPWVIKMRVAGAWQGAANYSTATSHLIDDANLGKTSLWSGVSGTGKPADNANNTWVDANGTIQGVSSGAGTAVSNSLIKVGGTNLWKNSTVAPAIMSGTGTSSLVSMTLPDGTTGNAARIVNTGATTLTVRIYNSIRANDTYSISFWHKEGTATNWFIDVCDSNVTAVTGSTSWTQFKKEGATVTNYSNSIYNFIDLSINPGLTVDLWHPKCEVGNKCSDWTPAPEDITASVEAAKNAADAAQNDATAANAELDKIGSDSWLSPGEKPSTIEKWNVLSAEQSNLTAKAAAYNQSTTAYTTALASLQSYLLGLSPAWADTANFSPIDPVTWKNLWEAAYNERNALLINIANEAGKRAEWLGLTGKPDTAGNAVCKSTFEDGTTGKWTGSHAACVVLASPGTSWAKQLVIRGRDTLELGSDFSVTPGEVLYVSADVNTSASNNYNSAVGVMLANSAGANTWMGVSVPKSTAYTKITGSLTVPAGYIRAVPWLQIDGPTNQTTDQVGICNIYIGKQELGSTRNNVTYSGVAPLSPNNGDIWIDTSTTPVVNKIRVAGAWVISANKTTELSGSGVNYMNPRYQSFGEANLPPISVGNGTATRDGTQGYFGNGSLKLVATGNDNWCYLSSGSSDFNFSTQPNSKWIVSFYVKSTTASAQGEVWWCNGNGQGSSVYFNTSATANTWTRISIFFDKSSDPATLACLRLDNNTSGVTMWFDGIMVEPQLGTLTSPSPFSASPNFLEQYTGALDATKNTVTSSPTSPPNPVNGDIWIDTLVSPNLTKVRVAGAWVVGANYVTSTSHITDDAGLGNKALWSGIPSGTGKPEDYATKNVVTYSATAPSNPSNGDLWCDQSVNPWLLKMRVGNAWQGAANYSTATSHLADDANLGKTALWANVTAKPTLYQVIARGGSDTSYSGIANGLKNAETNTLIYGSSRSYNVVKLDRSTNTIVERQIFDVYASATNAESMATYLNALTNQHVVIVMTADEPSANRLTANLLAAMKRCGAGPKYTSPNFKYRGAYVLIGVVGCGENNGFEAYSGTVTADTTATVDVCFYFQNGQIIISGSASSNTITDLGYSGALDATSNPVYVQSATPTGSEGAVWVDITNASVPVTKIYKSGAWTIGANKTTEVGGTGVNYAHPRYSNFEESSLPPVNASNCTVALDTSAGMFGTQCLKIYNVANSDGFVYLSDSNGSGKFPIPAGQKWILSAYVKVTSTANLELMLFLPTSNTHRGGSTTVSSTTWQRIAYVIDLTDLSDTSAIIRIDNNAGSCTAYFDGIMLEPMIGTNTNPSPYQKAPNFLETYVGALDANKTYVDGSGNLQGVSSGAGTAVSNSLLVPSITNAQTSANLAAISGGNIVHKAYFEDLSVGGWGGAYVETQNYFINSKRYIVLLNLRDCIETDGYMTPVSVGETLYAGMYAYTAQSTYPISIGVVCYDKSGNVSNWLAIASLAAGTGWTKIDGSATIPANTAYVRPWIQVNGPVGSTGTCAANSMYISRAQLGANKTYVDGSGNLQGVSSGAGTQVDNSKVLIGGANLWKNSEKTTFAAVVSGTAGITTQSVVLPDNSAGTVIQVVTTAGAAVLRVAQAVRSNGAHSMSFWHRTSSGTAAWTVDICDAVPAGGGSINSTTTWQQYKSEGTVISNWSTTYHFIDINLPTGVTLWLWHPKCEYGTKCTNWTPAAEDTAAALNTAQTTADSAISELNIYASDSYLSKVEKKGAIDAWNAIWNEKQSIIDQAGLFGVSSAAYTGAITTLQTYLDGLSPSWSNVSVNTPINPTTWRTNWTAVYSTKQSLLIAIDAAAATKADWSSVRYRPDSQGNMVRKSSFEDGSAAQWTGSLGVEASPGTAWAKRLYIYGRDHLENGSDFPVTPGESIWCAADMCTTASSVVATLGLQIKNSAGTVIAWLGGCNIAAGQGWQRKEGKLTIPANAVSAIPWIQMDGAEGQATSFGWFANISISRSQLGSTVGADWFTNLSNTPSDSLYSHDDGAALGVNGAFSVWNGAYPKNWIAWNGTVTRDTTGLTDGTAAIKMTTTNAPCGIQSNVFGLSAPSSAGSAVVAGVSINVSAWTSGICGALVRIYTNASFTAYSEDSMTVTGVTSGWVRKNVIVQLGNVNDQIYGVRVYLLGSWVGFGADSNLTCAFKNVSLSIIDNKVVNKSVGLSESAGVMTIVPNTTTPGATVTVVNSNNKITKTNVGNYMGSLAVTTGYIDDLAVTNAKVGNIIKSNNFNGVVDEATGVISTGGTQGWAIGKAGQMVVDAAHIRGQLSASQVYTTTLTSLNTNIGEATAGKIRNGGNTNFVDLNATGSSDFIRAGNGLVRITADGRAYFAGTKTPTPLTWTGAVKVWERTSTGVIQDFGVFWIDTGINITDGTDDDQMYVARNGSVASYASPNIVPDGNGQYSFFDVDLAVAIRGAMSSNGYNPYGTGKKRLMIRATVHCTPVGMTSGSAYINITSLQYVIDYVS